MMKKLFDRYYLVLMRGYGECFVSYVVSSNMSMSLTVNIVSFVILFGNDLLSQYTLWCFGGFVVIGTIIMEVLDFIYNKKYREKLREEYKDERYESRRNGVVWVVVYEVLTVALFILAVFMTMPET